MRYALFQHGLLLLVAMVGAAGCQPTNSATNVQGDLDELTNLSTEQRETSMSGSGDLETATFGGGCFWCTEAVFQRLRGVASVASGYSGGDVKNPTYEAVCSGTTGHAEVIQVTFDPNVLGYDELLKVFFHTHDPTTLNRQGADVGTQYRSVIYYHDDAQRATAERVKDSLSSEFSDPIVTEISPLSVFYQAEAYHQNYFNDNQRQPYCSYVIGPKLEKFQKLFADKVAEDD